MTAVAKALPESPDQRREFARALQESRIPDRTRDWPAGLDLEALGRTEPKKPQFIIPDWLPIGYASLLAGHGGAGKSGIGLHLAVCIAAGLPFLGLEVARRRVVYMSCEDRQDTLHWRLSRICRHESLDLGDLRGWLEIVDLVGHDSVLWERDQMNGSTLTPSFAALANRMQATECELLVVDGISDTYAGSNGSKAEVKRYVNALVGLVPADRGAVLLIGHIDKKAAKEGAGSEGYDGTTGWHNAVRARWYLYPKTERGEESERPERTGELALELQKSNNGRSDLELRLRWDDAAGMFLGEAAGVSMFDRKERERAERQGVLLAMRDCAEAGHTVPAAASGRRTAFHVLSLRPGFPDTLRTGKPALRRFWRVIEELRAINAIEEDSIRRKDRHFTRVFKLTTEGMRACGQ